MTISRRSTACVLALALVAGLLSAQDQIEGFEAATPPAVPPLTLRWGLGAGFQNADFPMSDTEVGASRILTTPNTPLYFALAAAWQGLGGSVKLTIPGSIDAIDERGVSEFTNIQVQVYQPRYAVDLAFQQHRGFFVDNAEEFASAPQDIRIPEMYIQTAAATFLYARNERANLRTAYHLDRPPRTSFLSLVWMAAASRVRLEAPGGPGARITGLDGTLWSESMAIESYSALGGVGLSGMLTHRSLFLASTASIALGLQRTGYAVSERDGVEWRAVPQFSLRASVGYNGRAWFLAALVGADARNVQTPFLEATQGSVKIDIVFGRRYSMRRWRGTRGVRLR